MPRTIEPDGLDNLVTGDILTFKDPRIAPARVRRVSNPFREIPVGDLREGDVIKYEPGPWKRIEKIAEGRAKGWRILHVRSGKNGIGEKKRVQLQIRDSVKRRDPDPKILLIFLKAYGEENQIFDPETKKFIPDPEEYVVYEIASAHPISIEELKRSGARLLRTRNRKEKE